MIFTEAIFFLFFAAVFVLYWKCPIVSRKWILLIASLLFYVWWDWRFLGVLVIAILATWMAAGLLVGSAGQSRKTSILFVGVGILLGQLGVFKYSGFFIETLCWSGGICVGAMPNQVLTLVLPLGISFFTFQSISYLIDLQANRENRKSFLDVAVYISFFPQLVAGPIVRGHQFFPQLAQLPLKPSNRQLQSGLGVFLVGFLMKAWFADPIGVFTDQVFENFTNLDSKTLWFGTLGFGIQIYFDFAGYSLMAIGSARLLGIDLPRNFDHPYASTSLVEFWRRWHISLSQWFRDYLYIPMGGSRVSELKRSRNLLLTMGLCGLWHGAGWNFIFWGFLHGFGVTVNHIWAKSKASKVIEEPGVEALWVTISWISTQGFVFLAWIPFRASDFEEALLFFAYLFGDLAALSPDSTTLKIPSTLIISALSLELILGVFKKRELSFKWSGRLNGALLGLLVALALFALPDNAREFVYFQF